MAVRLIHEIWAIDDETGHPLVTHVFFGQDEAEALERYQDHASRDGNLQECFAGNPKTNRAMVTIDGRPRLCAIRWSFDAGRPQEAQAPAEVFLEPPRRGFIPRLISGGAGMPGPAGPGGGGRRPAVRVGSLPIPVPEPMPAAMRNAPPAPRPPEHMECDGDVCVVKPGRKGG